MKKKDRKKITFETHLYLVQLGSILLSIVICVLVAMFISISSQLQIIGDNLLNTANTLSAGPTIMNTVRLGYTPEICKMYLEDLMDDMPLVDSFTIVDENGKVLYHTDPIFIGTYVEEESEWQILKDGEAFIENRAPDSHTPQRRRVAFAAIKENDGDIIGFVAVSINFWRQFNTVLGSLPIYLVATIILLSIGFLFTTTSLKSIRRQLRGYDPEQFAKIYDGNTNVLNIIDKGVIAINTDKRITIINNIGCEILGLPVIPYDRVPIQDVMPQSQLPQVLETEQAIYNEHIVIHGKNLLITHLPLYSNGQLTGAVSLFHDAEVMNQMAEQLEDANNMVETLRAFNHEFMNKLHVILGYLETDHIEEAKTYLLQSSMESSQSISQISKTIAHQGIAAIIIGKAIRAAELDITLNIVPESYCKTLTTGVPSNVYVTILGNLLQNAIEELNSCDHELKEIQLTLFVDSESTYISVLDTGRGMPEELIDKVTERNISTKGPGRGTGLYLVHSLVDDLHGSLKIESDPGEGTDISVMIHNITNT